MCWTWISSERYDVCMNSLDELWGNEQILHNIKSAVKNDKVNHAYIIDGPKGMGKMTLAKAFAKTLNCEAGDVAPCCNCSSCIAFDSDNNPDIIYVTHKKSVISVDDIREQIGKNIELKPYKYRYKIFIVRDADLMNVQAQNALLKTLEEPPSYGVFLLLSENYNKLLVTILSRCVMMRLKPLPPNTVKEYLVKNTGMSYEQAEVYALYSQGNIGKAMEISTSEGFKALRSKVIDIAVKLETADLIEVYCIVDKLSEIKEDIQEALDILYMLYRDALVNKSVGDNRYTIQKDRINDVENIARDISSGILMKRCDAVFEAKQQLRQNANFQMTMEVMLLKLKEK